MLDTNIVIGVQLNQSLSRAVHNAVEAGPCVLSVLSYWEVIIKSAKGKLELDYDAAIWWETALFDLSAVALPLRADHLAEVGKLPPIHRDPFDRALVAQAIAENLTLVTADRTIFQYAGPRLRILA